MRMYSATSGRTGARGVIIGVLLLAGALFPPPLAAAPATLLNASFDVSRELFQNVNSAFVAHWKSPGGDAVSIKQSHAGSGKQARAVVDGLEADVVTLNQASDIDYIAQNGRLIPANWAKLLPNHSVPYTSTIIFLVRKGNPKAIQDWSDLARTNVSVVLPNPKTSGNGRYGYLSAYLFALDRAQGDRAAARDFVRALFRNVPVLDTGGRGATTTFADRGIGDVLVSFEAEILQLLKERPGQFELVAPSQSVTAEMPVAVVERVAKRRGTDRLARSYLEFLYTEEGQNIIAKNFFRPTSAPVLAQYENQFRKLKLRDVESDLGGWGDVQKTHFAEGGLFDQIYQTRK